MRFAHPCVLILLQPASTGCIPEIIPTETFGNGAGDGAPMPDIAGAETDGDSHGWCCACDSWIGGSLKCMSSPASERR